MIKQLSYARYHCKADRAPVPGGEVVEKGQHEAWQNTPIGVALCPVKARESSCSERKARRTRSLCMAATKGQPSYWSS